MKTFVMAVFALSVSFSISNLKAADTDAANSNETAKADVAPQPIVAGTPSNMKIGGLLQAWFVSDPTKEFSGGTKDSTFRLRRAEVGLNGDITPVFGFSVGLDAASGLNVGVSTNSTGAVTSVKPNQASTYLRDAVLSIKAAKLIDGLNDIAPNMEIDAGQMHTGITEEGLRSSSQLDLLERSQLARTYGDVRDVGMMLKDSHQYADYSVGVFNGDGNNTADNNNSKTVSGRLVLKPVSEFKIGASGLTGETGSDRAAQTRYGADAQFEKGPVSVKTEYLMGSNGNSDFHGYYIQPGCFILASEVQLVARYDSLITDGVEVREISGGMNYYLTKYNAKIQLEYLRRNNEASSDDNVVMAGLQTAF